MSRIDEFVMIRVKDKGDLYVHQDANWNVIGTTDLGGSVVEADVLTPYGQLTVNQAERDQGGSVKGYGDRDGDVDATDKGTPGSPCTGTVTGACRILDLDPALDSALPASRADRQAIVGFAHSAVSRVHGDYDSADATLFDALPQGPARHPGRIATNTDQPFGHQGLLFEPEIGSYQNRARQYDSNKRRFAQRDPLQRDAVHGVTGAGLILPVFSSRGLMIVPIAPWEQYDDGVKLYLHVGGNPVRFTDPTGRGHDRQDGECIMVCAAIGFLSPYALCAQRSYSNPGEHADNGAACDALGCTNGIYYVGWPWERG